MIQVNAKTFKYIDKDKLLPKLHEDRACFYVLCENEPDPTMAYSILRYIDNIIELIEDGFYDWQQGSE